MIRVLAKREVWQMPEKNIIAGRAIAIIVAGKQLVKIILTNPNGLSARRLVAILILTINRMDVIVIVAK